MTTENLLVTANRATPWGRVGKLDGPVMSAKEAIVAGELDWTVEPRSMFVSLPGDKRVRVDNRKGMIRSTDNALLGIVSNVYQPFQNIDAFEFADNILGEAQYDSVGSLRHGKVIFLVAKLDRKFYVAGSDEHELYVIFRTSHDGSKAISVNVTPIRVQCTNAVTFAIKNATYKWSFQHTSRLESKLAEAKDTIRRSIGYGERFEEEGTKLAGIHVSNDQVHELLEDLLPARPKTDEVIDQIMTYIDSPTNGYSGTAWGAMNAITEYFDHGRQTRSGEAVFTNVVDGQIAGIRNRASHQLLALA